MKEQLIQEILCRMLPALDNEQAVLLKETLEKELAGKEIVLSEEVSKELDVDYVGLFITSKRIEGCPFTMIPREEKLRAVYQHASIRYLQDDAMTNKSLRERFGLADTYSASISRLIKEAVKEQIIKPLDDSTSNRYIRYIPAWA